MVLACALAGTARPQEAYARLCQWDSKWYAWIAEHGYLEPRPGVPEGQFPVGFFPGFPLLGRLAAALTGLPAELAVVLAAQLSCVGFWVYVVLFLRRWQAPWWVAVGAVVVIAVHPCAFFLVTGYSESLFLMGLLGFLYWSGVGGWRGWLLALGHGLLMTATRIVGLPLVICPVAAAVGLGVVEKRWRLLPPLAGGGLASLGALLFFAYCQLAFGQWNLYMAIQKTGWGVRPDYLVLLHLDIYRLDVPLFVEGVFNPNALSRLCVPFTVFVAGVLLILEWKAPKRGMPVGFYLAAALMFFVAVSGLANSGLVSMIRYTFCVHVMLTLAAANLLTRRPVPVGNMRWISGIAVTAAAIVSLIFQIVLIGIFTHGAWVA